MSYNCVLFNIVLCDRISFNKIKLQSYKVMQLVHNIKNSTEKTLKAFKRTPASCCYCYFAKSLLAYF